MENAALVKQHFSVISQPNYNILVPNDCRRNQYKITQGQLVQEHVISPQTLFQMYPAAAYLCVQSIKHMNELRSFFVSLFENNPLQASKLDEFFKTFRFVQEANLKQFPKALQSRLFFVYTKGDLVQQ